jgi:hypothetical protein
MKETSNPRRRRLNETDQELKLRFFNAGRIIRDQGMQWRKL